MKPPSVTRAMLRGDRAELSRLGKLGAAKRRQNRARPYLRPQPLNPFDPVLNEDGDVVPRADLMN